MAGHSKWDNIKHRKGAQDAKRSKKFAKFSKEIMVAASLGGSDIESNSTLRLAISKAKAQSMPKKNIESAIQKGIGNSSNINFKEISYGGNVGGVSFLIKYLSDNEKRVSSEIQNLFSKVNGSVTSVSAVSYVFDRKGVLEIPKNYSDEETIMTKIIDAGAEDFEISNDSYFIYTKPSFFSKVKDKLILEGIKNFKIAEVKYIPNNLIKLSKEKTKKIFNFIEKLENEDDIQDIYHNLDLNFLN